MGMRRCSVVVFALGLVVAGCSDDDGGATTTVGSDEVTTTVPAATTTTAPWGETVEPGAEGLLADSNLLLREDFQDGEITDWTVDAGWYLLSAGERRLLAAGGPAWARLGQGDDWSRYAARFGVLIHQGSLGLSVAVGDAGRYVVHLTDAGVYLLKDAPYGSFTTLGSALPIPTGEPHGVAVGVDGGHIQVYLDGVLLIDATDPSPLPGGTIGLGAADGSSVQVDNIVVAALQGPLPALQAPGEPAAAPPAPESVDPGPGEEANDSATANLALTGVSYPMVIERGEQFDVTLTVTNRGGVSVGSFSVAWTSAGDGCEAAIEGLAVGGSTHLTCRAPSYEFTGDEEWLAAADSTGMIDEGAWEGDNLATGTITVGPPTVEVGGTPNLVVGWYTLSPEAPAPGDPIVLQFGMSQTAADWGGDLPLIHFRMLYEDGTTACSDAVFEGETGGTCEIPAFADSGEYWLRMEIDANDVVAESNESDNSTFVTVAVSEFTLVILPNMHFSTGVIFEPGAPRAGQAFTATVWFITDPIGAALPMHTTRLEIDGVVVCSDDTTDRSARTISDIDGLTAGAHTWLASIDADDDVAESNENDNLSWGQLTVGP